MPTLEDIHNLNKKHVCPDGYVWWIEQTTSGFTGHLAERHGPLATFSHVSRSRVERTILGLLQYHRRG